MPNTTRTGVNAIAFYLPQFHQIPENDAWWGKGFTEWTNVRKARPLYPGHAQPRVPSQLGYYDLTSSRARDAQAALAKASGIEAFCYWHYWFGGGRRILEKPFAEVLSSGAPDFPFCLCWANQSWTGVWHGAPNRMLMEQSYPGEEDNRAHFELVLSAFQDSRYLRIEGKPVFLVYAPAALPDASRFVASWREMAAEADLPGLFLIGMTANVEHHSLREFDAVMLNAPGDFLNARALTGVERLGRRFAASRVADFLPTTLRKKLGAPRVFEYSEVVESAFSGLPQDERVVPCVLPGWDNTPRSGRRGVVFDHVEPSLFERYLQKAVRRALDRPEGKRLVFLKAWNEWAEGNYLEPDAIYGSDMLDVVSRVLRNADD